MALQDVFTAVRERRRTITVYGPPTARSLVEELRAALADWNVSLRHVQDDATPRAVVRADGEEIATVHAAGSGRLLASGSAGLARHLDGETFTTDDPDQAAAAAREIEDRVWRAGGGTVHAGFRARSPLDPEPDVYRTLAADDVHVHVHAAPSVDPPDGPFAVHELADPAAEDVCFLAYDGAGAPERACAVLAEGVPGGGDVDAVLTYDPSLVASLICDLRGTDAPVA